MYLLQYIPTVIKPELEDSSLLTCYAVLFGIQIPILQSAVPLCSVVKQSGSLGLPERRQSLHNVGNYLPVDTV